MNRKVSNIFLVVGVGLFIAAMGWFIISDAGKFTGITGLEFGSDNNTESNYVVPPMEADYQNEQFRFSLKLPQGFTATQLPHDGKGTPVVLQDAAGNGIQIYVTENVGDVRVLTERDIKSEIPDMQVTDAQEVEIGADHKGVAFMSDNEAYNRASREVWFIFNGNLYQISTYAHLDNLLQAMFSSWQFY